MGICRIGSGVPVKAALNPESTDGVQVMGVIVSLGEKIERTLGNNIPLKNSNIRMIALPVTSGTRRLKLYCFFLGFSLGLSFTLRSGKFRAQSTFLIGHP